MYPMASVREMVHELGCEEVTEANFYEQMERFANALENKTSSFKEEPEEEFHNLVQNLDSLKEEKGEEMSTPCPQLNGLENMGNTCYLNSCLQIMNLMEEFNKTFLETKCEDGLAEEWRQLVNIMWRVSNKMVTPRRFLARLQHIAHVKGRDEFCRGLHMQNDANDFFYFMLECLHDDTKNKNQTSYPRTSKHKSLNEYLNDLEQREGVSMISRLFTSCLLYEYVNPNDESITEFMKIEHGWTVELSIPLSSTSTLEDCFLETFRSEIMDGDNAWFDEKVNMKKAVKKNTYLCYCPDILFLHLKRWHNGLTKNSCLVKAPFELDLGDFVVGEHAASAKYELFGTINHVGGIMGGHYTASINQQGQWYLANDAHVHPQEPASVNNASNYCLFYRKIK
jgi:ubiquitin C-terminal hydrolase